MTRFSPKHVLKEIVMIFLAVASILLLVQEVYSTLNLATIPGLGTLDLVISAIFLLDFFIHFRLSSHKNTFLSHHWPELLAAVPFTGHIAAPLTAIRLVSSFSLLHLFRIIRLIIRIRILLEVSLEYTRHAYLIYIFTTVSFVVFTGAAAFYYFEFGANPNLHDYWDAVWWAIVTSTTIGYGDIFPVTPTGRVIAVIVMVFGITALGTFIATMDSVFLGNRLQKLKKTV